MAFQALRNQVKVVLEGVSSIQEVRDYPSEAFGGYPAAMVVTTRNESEFQTTIENKRIYVFTIFLIQLIEKKNERQARRIIEGVVDDVIDTFDQDQLLSGVSLPANETMIIVRPALSEIYVWESSGTRYIVAEMELGITVQFNIEL